MEATSSASASSSMPHGNQDATTPKRKRTTPSTNCYHCYQVFINHRGSDVKKTLASIIYHWLQGKGVQVFLDEDEFQPGQPLKSTIEEAIWSSSVHIAIFSKRYAESNWCLDELCLMSKTRAPIIPVFFDVRPSDLRWIENGEYASAFAEHEKEGRFDTQTISDWKLALKEVAGISGLDLHDSDKIKGDWGQLLKSLEDAVFQNLKPVPLEVATDPVGLDEIIRDFESFMESELQNKNKKVKIVGIVGLGGSGKTTLAKEFFNRQSPSFQRSSFLVDLRDASNRNALPGLQSKLLQDLHMGDCKIDSVSEGKGIIRKRLRSSTPRVLIVLDDIDHPNQVEALLVKDVLGSGSLIVLTSRDEEPLKLSDAFIYKIKALSPEHAQHLFCEHAFQQSYPMVGFENLVEMFCKNCGGLPLFLKVMGAHLRVNAGNDREVWEDELKHIAKDILNILEFSYNAPSNEEKQIFLDIACFFLGEDKKLAIHVWDKCEGRGLLRLNALVNKCLVGFDSENHFKMHDHVRDFGREIASKESPYRLWNKTQAANFPEQPKATKEFRGIMAATYNYFQLRDYDVAEYVRTLIFESSYRPPLEEIALSALKILAIYGDCFNIQLAVQLKNLVWLRWVECSYTNISAWLISMKNLTVLELFGEKIEEWPLRDERVQVQLRELRIVRTNLSMISISRNVCPCLEHLDLSYNLKFTEIRHLPQNLVKLNLEGCENLVELRGLEHLSRLRDMNIYECRALGEVPKLQYFLSLEMLNASSCSNLQHIQGLEHLSKLQNVDISCCFELRELPKLQHLPSLEELFVSDCAKLQHIQGLEDLSKLRNVKISMCEKLRELPTLQHLLSLEELSVSYCAKLQHIPGLEHLPKLRNVHISTCQKLRELPKLLHLPSLEKLSVSDCAKLQHIQGLEHLPKLQNIHISTCQKLPKLPNLQHLPFLEELSVSDCAKLQHMQGLEHLSQLQKLIIWNCSELRELPKLQYLPSLEELTVSDCAKLQHMQGLEHLPQLQKLIIGNCSELRQLPNLQQLRSLKELSVYYCAKLQHMQGLEQLSKLRKVFISCCFELRELPKLQHLPSLEELSVFDCAKLQHMQGLEDLPQLRELTISGCPELQEFPNLAHLISLEKVKASECPKVHGLQGFDQLEKLKSLTMSAVDHKVIWNAMEQMKKLPRRLCLRARAQVNYLKNPDPPVIDSNIHQNVPVWKVSTWTVADQMDLHTENVHECEWPASAAEENSPRWLMLGFVVKFPTVVQSCRYFVVYAVICSNSMDCLRTENFGTVVQARNLYKASLHTRMYHFGSKNKVNRPWMNSGYEVKKPWMATGSEANVLEVVKKVFAPLSPSLTGTRLHSKRSSRYGYMPKIIS